MAAQSRRSSSVAAELEGTLLISGSLFPYFLLVALEAGSLLRAGVLLALYPLVALLGVALSNDDVPLLVMTFVSTAGLPVGDVASVAKATLPRFFLGDLRDTAFRAFARHAAGEKYVVTRLPTVMVEPFVKEYVADGARVVGTELRVFRRGRRFTGAVATPGNATTTGDRSLGALMGVLGRERVIDVGLYCSGGGGAVNQQPAFLQICVERCVVSSTPAPPLPRSEYVRPLIFHDGRLVVRPDPLTCLLVVVWLPLGILLAVVRILNGIFPYGVSLLLAAVTGFQIRHHGATADDAGSEPERRRGTLYACNHQTLMDPVILSRVLQRKVTAVTFSLAGLSELIAPIPTVRLTRDRPRDHLIMQTALARGDLAVCPEGTTCREPYLLRFSPLFAEITGEVTPVAVLARGTMFHGTTVRGHKWMDSFFFLMNPAPWYQVWLLSPVATFAGVDDEALSRNVANHVQRVIGDALGFQCTTLTRRDKYRMIAGHDGAVDTRAPVAS